MSAGKKEVQFNYDEAREIGSKVRYSYLDDVAIKYFAQRCGMTVLQLNYENIDGSVQFFFAYGVERIRETSRIFLVFPSASAEKNCKTQGMLAAIAAEQALGRNVDTSQLASGFLVAYTLLNNVGLKQLESATTLPFHVGSAEYVLPCVN